MGMKMWESLQLLIAIGLALVDVILSTGTLTQRGVSEYLTETLRPQVVDLGQYTVAEWRAPT